MSPLRTLFVTITLGTSMLVASCAGKASPDIAGRSGSVANSGGVLQPEALDALDRMAEWLEGQPRLRLVIQDSVETMDESGDWLTLHHERTVTVRRPDRLRVDVNGDREVENVIYNGETVTLALPAQGLYAQDKTAPTIDGMLADIAERYGVRRPAGDLVRTGISQRVRERAGSAELLGDSLVRGHRCTHLRFTVPAGSWELWINKDGDPTPRKIVIRYTSFPGSPRYTMYVMGVETPAALGEELFQFSPAGMEQIPFSPVETAGEKR